MSLAPSIDLIPPQLAVLATFDPGRPPANSVKGGVLETYSMEVEPVSGQKARMLSETARIDVMAGVFRRTGHDGLSQIRAGIEEQYPGPLQRMLDSFVLKRETPLAERTDDELAASIHVERWSTAAFARAGISGARIRPTREEIEGRIRVLDVERPISAQLENGFIGRGMELAQLSSFLAQPGGSAGSPGLRGNPAFLIYGVGGMGKSALVARFVKGIIDATQSPKPIWAYLDFDRPTLKPERIAPPSSPQFASRTQLVLDDIIRQIGAQVPDLRSLLEHDADSVRQTSRGGGLESLESSEPETGRSSAFKLAETLRNRGGTVVIMLDTFEEVERYGPDDAQFLYDMFDTMVTTCPAIRLVVSGRTPAIPFRTSPEYKLHIGELTEGDAQELLQHFVQSAAGDHVIDPKTANEVSEIVGRSPLSLKLAARAIVGEGIQAFDDVERRARTLGRVRDEFVRGFLYHRIIDHLKPADTSLRDPLRDVARAGLALRRITRPTIESILLPAMRRDPSQPLAVKLFAALSQETALVQIVDAQTLGVREELRGPALSALKLDDAALVRRVHGLAAAFYADNTLGANPTEALFHRLAGGERLDIGPARGDLAPALRAGLGDKLKMEMLDSLERSAAELPRESADLLKSLRQGGGVLDAEGDQIA